MKKRIFTLLLSSVFILSCLTGCGYDEPVNVPIPDPTQQSTDPTYPNMKWPEYGWTMDELLSVTYLCGKQLSYPLTVDDLGEEFTLDTDVLNLTDRFVTNTNYKGQFMAPCIFGEENNTEQDLKNFRSFNVAMPENAEGFSFSINGAGFESSKEEVIKALGLPDDQNPDAEMLFYYDRVDKKSKLSIMFNNDKPLEFSFSFAKGDNGE